MDRTAAPFGHATGVWFSWMVSMAWQVSALSRMKTPENLYPITNEAGEFRVNQFDAAAYVGARSSDKLLGAIIEVGANQPVVDLSLQPVGKGRGRLLTFATKEPLTGQAIQYWIELPNGNSRRAMNQFGGRVVTADDGTFELVGLVPGWEYRIYLERWSNGSIPIPGNVTAKLPGKVTVKPGESVDIGEVSPSPTRNP